MWHVSVARVMLPWLGGTMAKQSKQRSAQRALKRPRKQSAARDQMVEAVLASVAHDIRTPLTGILALSELLAASDIGEREREWAQGIRSTAEHLAALTSLIVEGVRADTKTIPLREDVFSPRALANAMALSLAARTEAHNLTGITSIAETLPEKVVGDALRLRAALENLIDNAVKFTEQGKVSFSVSTEQGEDKRLRLIFTVADSGIGLSAAEIQRLFRPFTQANPDIARRFGGAGLGLAFVKRLAGAMGGDLTVSSAPQAGSQFRLTVQVAPFAEEPSQGGRDASAGHPARAKLESFKVLCVEDNPYGRVVLNTILTELGQRVDFVGAGEAAVVAVDRGGYDVVLMDVTLPGIDGFEATRRIRALPGPGHTIPIIGITGRAAATDHTTARGAGMNAYLTKPVSPAALAAAISDAVASGRSSAG